MAFITQCPFCRHQAKVPDRALGASGHCRECANIFTIAPLDDHRFPDADLAPVPTRPTADDGADAVPGSAMATAIAKAVMSVDSGRSAAAGEPVAGMGAVTASSSGGWPRAESVVGAAALLLGAAALFCASVPGFCVLVRPLSALGLVNGLAAVALAQFSVRPHRLLPVAGSFVAAGVLSVALLFPALLGPAYSLSRQKVGPVSLAFRAIPLAGTAVAPDAADGVDARQFALQQGETRIQVVNVSIGVLPVPAKTTPRKGQPELLLIRLRVLEGQSTHPTQITPASQILKRETNRPTLTDQAGTAYPLQDSVDLAPVVSGRRTASFPAAVGDIVLGFDLPPAGWESLHLAVPATTWGGSGTFRFTIASTMLPPAGVTGARQRPKNRN
jgi:hypothetical protein